MRKYYRIPLIFLLLAATIGLFLRWQFIAPTPGIRYTFFLHGHSHVMFLGWVFNVLFLSSIEHNLPGSRRIYIEFFFGLQLLVVAMMISFPLQGYGAWSIIFTTVHTLAVMVFVPIFFKKTKGDQRVSTWFARASWAFFFISTAGPFMLGFLMANDLGKSTWSAFSIYYYLHFQYNGFFLFGILALFFQMLESRRIPFSRKNSLAFGKWMAAACIPAYALSILFAKPGVAFNLIGGGAALMQLLALVYLVRIIRETREQLRAHITPLVQKVLQLIFIGFIFKSVIQLASAHPFVAEMAYSLRTVVIAYLHLVLVGVISLFLLCWYLHRNLMAKSGWRIAMAVFLSGYIGSEVCLVLMPWWTRIMGNKAPSPEILIFAFSVLMVVATLQFLLSFRSTEAAVSEQRRSTDKNQFLD